MAAQKCGLLSERVSVSVFFMSAWLVGFAIFLVAFIFFHKVFKRGFGKSFFMRNIFRGGCEKEDFEENNQTKKEKKKIMRRR